MGTLTLQPGPTAGKDTYVTGYNSPGDASGATTLMIRGNSSERSIVLIQFDLSSIPSNATITSATLTLWYDTIDRWDNYNIDFEYITSSWNETDTWPGPSRGSTFTTGIGLNGNGTNNPINYNFTSAVQAWVDGSQPNYGFAMYAPTSYSDQEFVYSSNYGTASKRPKLVVNYNVPPNAPTGLSPSGTGGSPAFLTNPTPTLSWSFSDPDSGDTQADYQVQIVRTSDSTTVKDTGTVASSSTSYAVPGGTLSAGSTYKWRARTNDGVSGWGPWSSYQFVYVNSAPSASPTDPTGSSGSPQAVFTSQPTLSWSFSDPDSGDTQGNFQVQVADSGGTNVIDTGETAGSGGSYTVGSANALTYGSTYHWRVRVWDNHGQVGNWSSWYYFTPQQAPTQPTNLSPAGTSGAPAQILTLTPTITWTHNDPENDPQQSFEVIIYQQDGTTLVKDSGEVVSGTSSWSVPASTLAWDTEYSYKVRTKDTGSGQFGPYSGLQYFYTNKAPSPPTQLAPASGQVIDASQAQVFSWQHNDPDNDPQSAYQVQVIDSSSAVVYDSGKVASATSSMTLPASTVTNGNDYTWQVKTWDSQDQASAYSSQASFHTGTPPTVTITTPADGSSFGKAILQVDWTYSDAQGDAQQSFQAVLKDGGGATIEDTGAVYDSGARSYTFNNDLANNASYSVTVTVTDATGQTGTSTVSFTTSFVAPTVPTLGVTFSQANGKAVLAITNPDNNNSLPATDRNDIYRRKTGATDWVRIATNIPKNGGYDDFTVESGQSYDYKATAISTTDTTADSSVQTGSVDLVGVWFHDVTDPAGTVHQADHATGRREQPNTMFQMLDFEGRSAPVAESGTLAQDEMILEITNATLADWQAIRNLRQRRNVLCYRDSHGRKLFAVITRGRTEDANGAIDSHVRLTIQQVDYSEVV